MTDTPMATAAGARVAVLAGGRRQGDEVAAGGLTNQPDLKLCMGSECRGPQAGQDSAVSIGKSAPGW